MKNRKILLRITSAVVFLALFISVNGFGAEKVNVGSIDTHKVRIGDIDIAYKILGEGNPLSYTKIL